jgi:hypothetical protein
MNFSRIEPGVVEKADVVRPEYMKRSGDRFGKSFANGPDGTGIRVSGVGHDPETPVLGDGA